MSLKSRFKKLKRFFRSLFDQLGALSASEMGYTLTVGALVGAAVTVTGNVKQLDSIESLHLYNAQTMGQGAQQMIDDRKIEGPSVGGELSITMGMLMQEGLLPAEGIPDPSTVTANYNAEDSAVLVLNEAGSNESGAELRFYPKLVSSSVMKSDNSEGFHYVNETIEDKNGERTQASKIGNDHIFVPERNESADISRQL